MLMKNSPSSVLVTRSIEAEAGHQRGAQDVFGRLVFADQALRAAVEIGDESHRPSITARRQQAVEKVALHEAGSSTRGST
jgi:hypothetical protein